MKRLITLILPLITISYGALLYAMTPSGGNDITIIHAGTLLAVPGTAPKERQSLVISNGKIIEVIGLQFIHRFI